MLAACNGGEQGELITVFQIIVGRHVFSVNDPEQPDRSGDLQ